MCVRSAFSNSWNDLSPTENLTLFTKKEFSIPGAMQYSITRFHYDEKEQVTEIGSLNYENAGKTNKYLHLKFCKAGNSFCINEDCSNCKFGKTKQCEESNATVDVVDVKYYADHLLQFEKNKSSDSLLSFLPDSNSASVPYNFLLCPKTKNLLDGIVNHRYSGSFENIFVNAQLQMLLLACLDCIGNDKEAGLNCRFLSNEDDKEKISKAREILIENIGNPITIKELSKKVAMNECYLKKGFKEVFGTTIFDFYQSQRMEHAKYLLYEKALSVTDVSHLLGYSSISHFSTAFKKHTGLKPCELLK